MVISYPKTKTIWILSNVCVNVVLLISLFCGIFILLSPPPVFWTFNVSPTFSYCVYGFLTTTFIALLLTVIIFILVRYRTRNPFGYFQPRMLPAICNTPTQGGMVSAKEHDLALQKTPWGLETTREHCARSDSRTSDTTCGGEMLNSSFTSQGFQLLQDVAVQSFSSETPCSHRYGFEFNHGESPSPSLSRSEILSISSFDEKKEKNDSEALFRLMPQNTSTPKYLLDPSYPVVESQKNICRSGCLSNSISYSPQPGQEQQQKKQQPKLLPFVSLTYSSSQGYHEPWFSSCESDTRKQYNTLSSSDIQTTVLDSLGFSPEESYSCSFPNVCENLLNIAGSPEAHPNVCLKKSTLLYQNDNPCSSENTDMTRQISRKLSSSLAMRSVLQQLFPLSDPIQIYSVAHHTIFSLCYNNDIADFLHIIRRVVSLFIVQKSSFLYPNAILAAVSKILPSNADFSEWFNLVNRALDYMFSRVSFDTGGDELLSLVPAVIDMFAENKTTISQQKQFWHPQKFIDIFTCTYKRWLQDCLLQKQFMSLNISLFCKCLRSFLRMQHCHVDNFVATYCDLILGIKISQSNYRSSWVDELKNVLESCRRPPEQNLIEGGNKTLENSLLCDLLTDDHLKHPVKLWPCDENSLMDALVKILYVADHDPGSVSTNAESESSLLNSESNTLPIASDFCSPTTVHGSTGEMFPHLRSGVCNSSDEQDTASMDFHLNIDVPELSMNLGQCSYSPWKETCNGFGSQNSSMLISPPHMGITRRDSNQSQIEPFDSHFRGSFTSEDNLRGSETQQLYEKLLQECIMCESPKEAASILQTILTWCQDNLMIAERNCLFKASIKLLHVFVQHKKVACIFRVFQILEKMFDPNPSFDAVAGMIFCRLHDVDQATFYLSRAVCLFHGATNRCWSFISHFQGSESDCQIQIAGCPGVAICDTEDCITQAVLFYINHLTQQQRQEQSFQFIATRLEAFNCLPRLLSQALHWILKSNVDDRLIRAIFDIFITCKPVSVEEAQQQRCSQHIVVDSRIFATLTECCIRSKDSNMLLELLHQFKTSWSAFVQPDLQTWGVFIKVLGSRKCIDECHWIFHYMTEIQHLQPCEVTYGCFLDALINNDRMAEALALFEHLKTKDTVRLNTIMFSTLAKGFAQKKQLDNALKIHREMKESGIFINNVTYNTLVDACARVGAIDKARGLLEDMLASNVEPDLITFSTIAKGYCVKGDITRALELLDAMQQRGVSPDGILYNSLLDGCVRASRLDLCHDVWQRMNKANIPPSNFTLTILIKMFGRAGNLHQAFLLVHELPKRYGFHINAHVYTCLMSACIANKEYAKAVDIYHCMKKDGIRADAKTYETVLLGILRSGDFKNAVSVIREAFRLDAPNSTVNFSTDRRDAARSYHFRKNNQNQSNIRKTEYSNIPGLQMDPRHLCSLWNAMQQSSQMNNAMLQTVEDIQARYGSDGLPFFPFRDNVYVPHRNHRSTFSSARMNLNDAKTLVL